MGILRNTTPVVALMLFLLIAREIYPYTEPLNAEAVEGFEIEKVASGFGGPTCMHWVEDNLLLMCDRDGGRLLMLNASDDFSESTLLSGLTAPMGFTSPTITSLYLRQVFWLSTIEAAGTLRTGPFSSLVFQAAITKPTPLTHFQMGH